MSANFPAEGAARIFVVQSLCEGQGHTAAVYIRNEKIRHPKKYSLNNQRPCNWQGTAQNKKSRKPKLPGIFWR